MVNVLHQNLVAPDAVHPFSYKQSGDPGAVGAGKGWTDTTSGPPYQLKSRNAANTGWDLVGSVSLSDPTTTRGDLITRGVSAIQRFALGLAGAILTSNGTDPAWLSIGASGTALTSNGTTPAWSAAPTVTGESTASDFKTTGLTGATAATRFVGGTVSGSPLTGTFSVGDFIIDQSAKIWVCTGAGSPGTWGQAGGGMGNPMSANQDMITGGASGTPTRLAIGANNQVLTILAGVITWSNSAAGFSNPMTTLGDIIYGGTAGAGTRLANGANGQVLTITAGLPGWANPSGGGGGVTNNVTSALYLSRNCI